MVIRIFDDVETVTCPDCQGEGITRTNAHRDPATGVWEADEQPCVTCNGTGVVDPNPDQGDWDADTYYYGRGFAS